MGSSGRHTSRGDRVVLVVVAALFVVPALVLLLGDKPARLGFQMYSGYGETSATWQDPRGERHVVDLAPLVASLRADIDWTSVLPPALCERIAGAVRVEVTRTRPGEDATVGVSC